MDYNYSDYESAADYGASVSPELSGGIMTVLFGSLAFFFIFFIIIYVYFALCLMKIANKTNTPNAWFAWIPILNVILMIQIARKPIWWIILLFIPFVNIVISIILWMDMAKAVGKPNWLGILMIVPIANFIIPGYLAFSKSDGTSGVLKNPTSTI